MQESKEERAEQDAASLGSAGTLPTSIDSTTLVKMMEEDEDGIMKYVPSPNSGSDEFSSISQVDKEDPKLHKAYV